MKHRFFYQVIRFQCAYKKCEAMDIIQQIIALPQNGLKLIKAGSYKNKDIAFSIKNNDILERTSFHPIVTVKIEDGQESFVAMEFQIKKSVSALIIIYDILLLLFEILLIKDWLTGQLFSTWLLFMPIIMILMPLIFGAISFKVLSKEIKKIFLEALTTKS